MPVEANTAAIIRLVWARRLGLPDEALTDADEAAGDAAGEVIWLPAPVEDTSVLQLWRTTVVRGPDDLTAAVRDQLRGQVRDQVRDQLGGQAGDPAVPDLSTGAGRAAVEHRLGAVGGRPEWTELGYTDSYRPARPGSPSSTRSPSHPATGAPVPLVSRDLDDLAVLAAGAPPDDRIGLQLDELEEVVVLLDEDDHRPLAAAGYSESDGLLARLRVLVPPEHRRRGYGRLVADLAVDEALDQGLVVEGWLPQHATGAAALADSVRLSRIGWRLRFL